MSDRPDPISMDGRATRDLISRCLDSVATDAERAALDELVARDPSVARELARAAVLESSLEVVSREGADGTAPPVRSKPWSRLPRAQLLLVAAVLAISSIGGAFVLGRPLARWVASLSERRLALAPPAPSPARVATESAHEPPSTLAPESPGEPERLPVEETPSTPGTTGGESASKARTTSAVDALQAANKLRRQGRWADAARAYAQIANDRSGTAQGSVAALAAASLRLEHLNDPRGALRLYQTATHDSDLAAEAQLGIADCYHALGDRDAEMGTLRRLISAYPDALSRERAAQRLQALQSAKP